MHIGRKALEDVDLLSLMYHRVCKYCTNMTVEYGGTTATHECNNLMYWVDVGHAKNYMYVSMYFLVRNELTTLLACLRDQPNLDSIAALSPARFVLYVRNTYTCMYFRIIPVLFVSICLE